MRQTYRDGVLREQWDASTGLYTAWDASGVVIESRPLDADEEQALETATDQSSRLDDHETRIGLLEDAVFGQAPDPEEDETPVWSSPCPPNAVVRWPDAQGDRFRNVSGAWLVATPDEYPIGYVNLDVGQVDAWAAGVAYQVGDQVTYQGKTYQCAQAHQSQPGWTPVAVPALWVLVG